MHMPQGLPKVTGRRESDDFPDSGPLQMFQTKDEDR